ncbi:MAG: carboxylesterase family protein [Candidatus Andeanibacterium colombiense]|uniref:Carboxylic ester hydrolase n=1 Tax=Candidatus Andeanibacterium colombiense TaxID=3121345 RepID=A0AAJ5X4Z8_9SPHN|nr:MAG: carboxylesterase family protein [Sphingomonadaceae bacterium]
MRTWALGLAAALAFAAPAHAEIATAQVTGGTVAGETVNGISEFKGIPFAAPPVGDLRWQAPQALAPWAGTKRTVAFGPACMQGPILAQMGSTAPASEDCLYLDVWTPAHAPGDRLPVIAWIYGGGFNSGATSVPLYDGANFAKQGVVFVSIAYRVGMFGFLAAPELSAESGHGSGNYGMLDQIAGLKWVQANIARFGGDPAKVTIMGHSAGGFAVSMLNASPLAKGLFRGVISESGGNFTPVQSQPIGGARSLSLGMAEASGKAWLGALGVHTLAEARALPAATLLEAQGKPGAPMNQPPVDNYVLPGDQYLLWQQGRFNDVALLLGNTSDETSVFGSRKTTAASFADQIREGYGEKADAILAAFPHATDEEAAASARHLANQTTFEWNTRAWASQQTRYGKAPAYAYYFDRPTAQNPNGSGHGSEVGLVFANEDHRPGRTAWTDTDRALSAQLQGYWVNFAKTGNPNGAGLPEWPRYVAGEPTVLKVGAETKVIGTPNAAQVKAVDEYFAWRRGEER